jgi:hypothetical protein
LENAMLYTSPISLDPMIMCQHWVQPIQSTVYSNVDSLPLSVTILGHQQNQIQSESHTHTSQTLWLALTSASKYIKMLPGPPAGLQCALWLCKYILRCIWNHLQLWRCIQDATRLTNRIVKFCRSWKLCTGPQETLRATDTSAQHCRRLWKQLRLLRNLSVRPGAKFSHQCILAFHNNKALRWSYLFLFKLQGSLHHDMPCNI